MSARTTVLWALCGGLLVVALGCSSGSDDPSGSSPDTRPASAAEPARSGLAAGEVLDSGDVLAAPDGLTELAVDPSGDVVLSYRPDRQLDPRRANVAPIPSEVEECNDWECLINQPRPLWSTGTGGHPGARLVMQTDGDLQVLDGDTVVWRSNTSGGPGAELVLEAGGNLAIVDSSTAQVSPAQAPSASRATLTPAVVRLPGAADAELRQVQTAPPPPRFSTDTTVPTYEGDALASGATLDPGEYLQSDNGEYELDMAEDGAAMLFSMLGVPCPSWVAPSVAEQGEYEDEQQGVPLPSVLGTPTGITAGSYLTMQADGNLVLYSPSGAAGWASNTSGNNGATLSLQTDGNLVVYSTSGAALWASNTNDTPSTVLCRGDTLSDTQQLLGLGSPYGTGHQMQFASDVPGWELDIYKVGGPTETYRVWHDTSAPSEVFLLMQDDGNLVVYSGAPTSAPTSSNAPLWATNTNGEQDTFAELDQGNLVVWQVTVANGTPTPTALWNTTNGPTGKSISQSKDGGQKLLEELLEVIA